MNATLQSAINAIRSAPLADHSDILALANAFAARIADAERQFPSLDLSLVSERADAVAEALDAVYVRELTDAEALDFFREYAA